MKRQLLPIILAVAFYLPSAASQTDTIPRPDFSKFQKVSLLSPQFKSFTIPANIPHTDFTVSPIRLNYNPDIYQMKRILSQDLYHLKIQTRNNEWRNLFAGLLISFVKQ